MNKLYAIPGFTGYFADKNGNIYSALKQGCRDRYDKSKWLKEPVKMKYRITKNGYCRVYMRPDGSDKRIDVYVHRIIAMMFIPNPLNLPEVNHKNSKPTDNRACNLEWVTRSVNWAYAFSDKGFRDRDDSTGRFTRRKGKRKTKKYGLYITWNDDQFWE